MICSNRRACTYITAVVYKQTKVHSGIKHAGIARQPHADPHLHSVPLMRPVHNDAKMLLFKSPIFCIHASQNLDSRPPNPKKGTVSSERIETDDTISEQCAR